MNTFNFTTPKGTQFTITAHPNLAFIITADIAPTMGVGAIGIHNDELVIIGTQVDANHEPIDDAMPGVIVVPQSELLPLLKFFNTNMDPTADLFTRFGTVRWPFGVPERIITKDTPFVS